MKNIFEKIAAFFKSAKNILKKLRWREIAAVTALAVLAGFIIVPSVSKSAQNGKRNKCSSSMYLMVEHLSDHLSDDDGDYWQEIALKSGGREAISRLAEELLEKEGRKIDENDYYFELSGKNLVARCKKHEDITDHKILLATLEDTDEEQKQGVPGWNVNMQREIHDMGALSDDAIIIDAGVLGKYCLAAWAWEDYVKEANEAEENDKSFSASIVLFDGVYYYYPDGFRIRKGAANNTPFKYAEDTESPRKSAYYIPFDTSSVTIGRFSSDNHDGSVMIDGDEIYIWQSKSSKDFGKGWIRVYCEHKKL